MSSPRICDRCMDVIPEPNVALYVNTADRLRDPQRREEPHEHHEYDLCRNCANSFAQFIAGTATEKVERK
jgi:hypothetical protein